MRRKKLRQKDDQGGYSERMSLFQHYGIGEGSLAEQMDADVQAAQRLLQPGDAVWRVMLSGR